MNCCSSSGQKLSCFNLGKTWDALTSCWYKWHHGEKARTPSGQRTTQLPPGGTLTSKLAESQLFNKEEVHWLRWVARDELLSVLSDSTKFELDLVLGSIYTDSTYTVHMYIILLCNYCVHPFFKGFPASHEKKGAPSNRHKTTVTLWLHPNPSLQPAHATSYASWEIHLAGVHLIALMKLEHIHRAIQSTF